MVADDEILRLIPHRPPFLWVDSIVLFEDDVITTEKLIPVDLDTFTGHYPGNPIMPGVLLCEIIFQSGALLMAKMNFAAKSEAHAVPVLTRIENAKFKRSVLPGDLVTVKVVVKEILSSVCFLKGTLKVKGKTAVQVVFACTLVTSSESD